MLRRFVRLLFVKSAIGAGQAAEGHVDVDSRGLRRLALFPDVFHDARQFDGRNQRFIPWRKWLVLPVNVPRRTAHAAALGKDRLLVEPFDIFFVITHSDSILSEWLAVGGWRYLALKQYRLTIRTLSPFSTPDNHPPTPIPLRTSSPDTPDRPCSGWLWGSRCRGLRGRGFAGESRRDLL